jgi:RNA polymerase sigma factor (sigma-70 family)
MPSAEEIAIIQGLRTGGTERERFENMLWKLFSNFIHWGITKYNLPKDEVRHAYDDAILCVIINIVTGRYKEDSNALLKTYAGTIFHRKCIDRIHSNGKNATTQNLKNLQPVQESLSEMLPDEIKNVVEEIIEREEQLKIKKCLDKIGEPCKDILELHASGYKDKEIAEMMKYSSSDVVKQSRYRCMEKLSHYYLNLYKYE